MMIPAKAKDTPLRREGRPSKLTPALTARLIEAIKDGAHYEPACAYAGIHYSTMREWITRGEGEDSGPYREFSDAIKKAVADMERRVVKRWVSLLDGDDCDWKAIATFLERRFPDRWARRVVKELSGPGGGPIQTETAAMPRGPMGTPEEAAKEYGAVFMEVLRGTYGDELDELDARDAERARNGSTRQR